MSKGKTGKRTLIEKLGGGEEGEDALALLVALFAENASFKEIEEMLPHVFFTRGGVAALKRDHGQELKRLLTAYLVQHGPVQAIGSSRPFRLAESGARGPRPKENPFFLPESWIPNAPPTSLDPEEEFRIAKEAIQEYERFETKGNKYARAAMKINQARLAAGVKKMISADMVERFMNTKK